MKAPRLRATVLASVLLLGSAVAPVATAAEGTALPLSGASAGDVPAGLPEVTTPFEGRVDVLGRDAEGLLWLYRGDGRGGWVSPALQIGNGWQSMTAIIGAGDFSGDGNVDVMARDTAGRLWLYRGNGRGGWAASGQQIGNGWQSMTAIIGPGDFSGDGYVDVLARDGGGLLWLYRGNGRGGWASSGQQVGNGWQGLTAVLAVGDFDGGGGDPAVNCAVVACVALTFDDGPSAYTERLLDILISRDAPATFFVVGSQVANRPATVRRQEAAGFAVENHTYSHPDLTTLSRAGQLSEVQKDDDALAAAGVARSTLLRPPYGAWNSDTRQLGKPLILWSVDPRDWDGKTADQVRSHVAANATAGSIVLLHDSHSTTVDAVPGIITDLRARGLTLVTVETLVPSMKPGDIVRSRTNITSVSSQPTAQSEVLRARDGSILGPVVDDAPFVPEK